MLIKWIKCQVNEENKSSFSNAQEGWGDLKQLDGFIGQIGGWDKNNPFEAGIISFWRDDRSYQAFMEQQHDGIFEKSNQRNTYSNISVQIFEKMFNTSKTDMTDFLSKGSLHRVADCFVETNKQLEFEHMQKEVWNKGMMASPGMFAGVFAEKKNGRYLVA
ncbi:YdbC family protein [Peribacillus butanolivorans]|uniref:YdbC family protein n=1 Tax=Peribacillus butanolivorans TaxID=421767 RepID=UPI0037CB761F